MSPGEAQPVEGKPYRMKPISEGNVLEALRSVKDPDLHRDIVSLNFVKSVAISGNDVSFTIELTTPACPVREELKSAAEKAAHREGMLNRPPADDPAAQERLKLRKQESGLAHRDDLKTFVDYIDADEKRI